MILSFFVFIIHSILKIIIYRFLVSERRNCTIVVPSSGFQSKISLFSNIRRSKMIPMSGWLLYKYLNFLNVKIKLTVLKSELKSRPQGVKSESLKREEERRTEKANREEISSYLNRII